MDKPPSAPKDPSTVGLVMMVSSGVITLILGAVLLAVLIFVVPRFQETFKDFGAELPFVTALVFKVSDILRGHWMLSALGACVAVAALAIPAVLLENERKALLWSYIVTAWVLLAVGAIAVIFGTYLPLIQLMSQMGQRSGS